MHHRKVSAKQGLGQSWSWSWSRPSRVPQFAPLNRDDRKSGGQAWSTRSGFFGREIGSAAASVSINGACGGLAIFGKRKESALPIRGQQHDFQLLHSRNESK
ncbi:hypothetical protein C8J56DRAFT_895974 [Mycena floridula]|nr:hypothetical protein C8J56DRAFT_895974 [Mycena floridula]